MSETSGKLGQSVRASPPTVLCRNALRPPLKRSADLAGAVLLLFLTAPAFLLAAFLVLLDGGPVFIARPRGGRGGREFGLLAFRTARPGVPGLTRSGHFLRWTSIEVLPRLLNVLRGEMSLVGPRPTTQEELDRTYAFFGGDAAYSLVRPGLVGPCDAGSRVGARVALDVAYALHPSLRADLAISARTLRITRFN